MGITERVAKEVAILVPKLIVGVRSTFFEIDQLTSRQIITLLFIHEQAQTKITDIAHNFDVSPPTITGIVTRLVTKDYLRRIRDERDRRIVYVSLSSKGKQFVDIFRETVRRRWQKILRYLNEEEQEFYLKILKKIISALSEEKHAEK